MTSPGYYKRLTRLKKLFWLYFLLLIFEGALRKWIVPQLSAPLLIVRDPVCLMIIWEAYRTHKWPSRWSGVIALLVLALVGLFVVQIIGGNPLIMGLYGLRSYLLPFPVIFIMGENLDEEDLRKLCECILWLLLPMTLLELGQYLMPSGSFLNRGAYEGAGQIGFIRSHVRSSGTFSFVLGAEYFESMAATFVLYGIASTGFAKRWMLWAGVFAIILAVPTMGSRGVLTQIAGLFVSVAICAAMGLSQFGKVLRIIVPVVFLSLLAAQLPVFSDALKSMTERVSGANATEGKDAGAVGAVVSRTIGPSLDAVEQAVSSGNWLGLGMGRSANALYVLGKSASSDNEIEREMSEFGVAGIGYALFKLFLAITLLGQALNRARGQQPLAMLMLPLAISTLLFTTPEQPTGQGFMVISMAFCIAAARMPNPTAADVPRLAFLRQPMLERRRLRKSFDVQRRRP